MQCDSADYIMLIIRALLKNPWVSIQCVEETPYAANLINPCAIRSVFSAMHISSSSNKGHQAPFFRLIPGVGVHLDRDRGPVICSPTPLAVSGKSNTLSRPKSRSRMRATGVRPILAASLCAAGVRFPAPGVREPFLIPAPTAGLLANLGVGVRPSLLKPLRRA